MSGAGPVRLQAIKETEAERRFELGRREPINSFRYGRILHLPGPVTIAGDLDSEWLSRQSALARGSTLVIVEGSLSVEGDVALQDEPAISLLVLGNLHCQVLRGDENQNILVTGDAVVDLAVIATQRDAALRIAGTTTTQFVVGNDDHALTVSLAPGATRITTDELPELLSRWGLTVGPDDAPCDVLLEHLRHPA